MVSQKCYVPPLCWWYLGWQKKQYYLILVSTRIWSKCLKSCRSRSQVYQLYCFGFISQ
jgi:hypothetical protein